MAQHRRITSTVHLQLKDECHSLDDANVHILDREDQWFGRSERGHQLSATYNPLTPHFR